MEHAALLDWLHGDVGALRRAYERLNARQLPPDAVWQKLGGVEVLTFPAREGGDAAIIHFHGGGFMAGSPVTHADIAERLRRHTGLAVHSVAYRLAPEHPAPAPAEDGASAVRRLVETGVKRLFLCGDSAGGAIALATEQHLSEKMRRHVACAASFYGAFGLLDTPSLRTLGSRADGTDHACMERYYALAGGEAYRVESLARPSSVPVYLVAADADPLRDDSLILAEAMARQGRPVILERVADALHGFLHGDETNRLAEAAMARFAAWLRKVLPAGSISSRTTSHSTAIPEINRFGHRASKKG